MSYNKTYNKTYNWGIIGCGLISFDFTNALLKSPRSKVVACGARKLEKAQKFAKQFEIPINNAYSSYDAVSKDHNVDIVYIGTIHPSHYQSAINALNNGKHVLCEKPIAMNARETEEMIDAARKNNVFLMEAMWTRFFPAYRKMRQLVEDGVIGDIVHYYGDFCVGMPSAEQVPRLWLNELGGGSILDLGCYAINPLSWIFGPRLPHKISAIGIVDKKYNIDTIVGVTAIYNNKQYAQFTCNFYANSFEEMMICGSKGRIKIESPFHCPTKIILYLNDGTIKTFEFKIENKYNTNFLNSEAMIYEIEETIKCLDEGRIESLQYTWNEMISCMKLMDEIRRQIGVKYKQDLKSKL